MSRRCGKPAPASRRSSRSPSRRRSARRCAASTPACARSKARRAPFLNAARGSAGTPPGDSRGRRQRTAGAVTGVTRRVSASTDRQGCYGCDAPGRPGADVGGGCPRVHELTRCRKVVMAGSAMRSPSKARLPLTGVFVLFIGVLAAAATVVGASHEVVRLAAAVAEAVVALALALAVVYLRGRYASAMAQAAEHVAESQQLVADVGRHADGLEQQDQQRRAQASARWAAVERAADQLVRGQLPAALAGKPVPPSLPARGSEANTEAAALFEPVTAAVRSGVAELRLELDDQRESARLAVVTLARRVQASAHRIQEEVTRMTERHRGDADVLESGMRVDHAASQQARHAQSVAVLCGEWPGQQWPQALALVDVARAASGRIVPYQRVGVSGEPDIGACASAAEPLIHLVAELLANAAQSSPPSTQVLVTVRIVLRGAVIEIDDGGVGMEEHELERARDIASGRRQVGLADLGEIPQTGLAVVGQYARRHGFGVDL